MVPNLFPVSLSDVARLEKIVDLNPDLKAYWLENGIGFFNGDENGDLIDEYVTNALFAPGQILTILENADDHDLRDYDKGMPFFDAADLTLFILAKDGRVICLSTGKEVEIASSFGVFIQKLQDDCTFHVDLW